jgi:two-component system NtrC family response regulator
LASTNRDLFEETRKGTFRMDLYYRLNVLHVHLPPLRERGDDIVILADYFINRYARRFNIPEKRFSLSARETLRAYFWPGNIRELENIVQRALLSSAGNSITASDLPLGNPDTRHTVSKTATTVETDSSVRPLRQARENAEIEAIERALDKADWNVSSAARLLCVDRKWLTKLMKYYKLTGDGSRKK